MLSSLPVSSHNCHFHSCNHKQLYEIPLVLSSILQYYCNVTFGVSAPMLLLTVIELIWVEMLGDIMDNAINILIFVITAISFLFCFRKDGRWDLRAGKKSLRFFTILSNLFCAVSALLWVLSSSYWAWLLKYVGTVAVTVTLLTVIFFLGPNMGYKPLFSGKDLYLHLCGPLLAIVSFCFMECQFALSFSLSLLGILPVIIYGFVYLVEVVILKNWEDFYGYNKDGKWKINMAAMFAGGFAVCMLIRILYSIWR